MAVVLVVVVPFAVVVPLLVVGIGLALGVLAIVAATALLLSPLLLIGWLIGGWPGRRDRFGSPPPDPPLHGRQRRRCDAAPSDPPWSGQPARQPLNHCETDQALHGHAVPEQRDRIERRRGCDAVRHPLQTRASR